MLKFEEVEIKQKELICIRLAKTKGAPHILATRSLSNAPVSIRGKLCSRPLKVNLGHVGSPAADLGTFNHYKLEPLALSLTNQATQW